jgi:hypothetical protein
MGKYDSLRNKAGFTWKVIGNVYALMEYEDISLYEYYTDVQASIQLYRNGRPRLREVFGDEIQMPAVSTPATSYGHVCGLGAIPMYPSNGEMAVTRLFDSLDEAVSQMKRLGDVDFAKTGIAPMHMAFRIRLQEAFPGEPVQYGASGQGPVTTAYLCNGERIFYELYDNPDLLLTYLELLTRSENAYHAFVSRAIMGRTPVDPSYGYIGDDSAALIPADMFPAFVLPFWEEQFLARTTKTRYIHCEGLRKSQLRYLEDVGIDSYDPSVSPLLVPKIIRDNCRIPFDWRLASFHLWNMSVQEITDFVFHLAADGASSTFLVLAQDMSEGGNLKKVQAYIAACKETVKVLAGGGSRDEVRTMASVKSGEAFWNAWTGYKGQGTADWNNSGQARG